MEWRSWRGMRLLPGETSAASGIAGTGESATATRSGSRFGKSAPGQAPAAPALPHRGQPRDAEQVAPPGIHVAGRPRAHVPWLPRSATIRPPMHELTKVLVARAQAADAAAADSLFDRYRPASAPGPAPHGRTVRRRPLDRHGGRDAGRHPRGAARHRPLRVPRRRLVPGLAAADREARTAASPARRERDQTRRPANHVEPGRRTLQPRCITVAGRDPRRTGGTGAGLPRTTTGTGTQRAAACPLSRSSHPPRSNPNCHCRPRAQRGALLSRAQARLARMLDTRGGA